MLLRIVQAFALVSLLSCASESIEDPMAASSTAADVPGDASSGTPSDPAADGDDDGVDSTAVPGGTSSDSGPAAEESGDGAPTDGWFAATTRVIFYAEHYAAISAHGLAINDQLSSAPGLVDYVFDFELNTGRAQSISLWETEQDFWMFVLTAAHAKAMTDLNDPVAGRDFSYATWWIDDERLPSREEADMHLGPEPESGPYPID